MSGAVTFQQFFGSALQATPHFHSLLPDGVWVSLDGGVRAVCLPRYGASTEGACEMRMRGESTASQCFTRVPTMTCQGGSSSTGARP